MIIDSTTQNIGSITFQAGNAAGFVIGTTGGNSLLLSSGGNIQISGGSASTSNTVTVNAPLVIEGAGGTYTFQNSSALGDGTLDIGGQISGGTAGTTLLTLGGGAGTGNPNVISGNIVNGTSTAFGVKVTSDTWNLTGTNTFGGVASSTYTTFSDGVTYTAGIDLTGGTLVLGSNTAAGANTIVALGGTIAAGPGGVTIANSIEANNNNFTIGGSNPLTLTGGVGFNGTNVLTVNNTALTTIGTGGQLQLRNRLTSAGGITINGSGNLTISGTVVNNSGGTGTGGVTLAAVGSLTYAGTGVLTLSSANTYGGSTTVSQGTVVAGNNTAFGTSASAITLGTTTAGLTGSANILTNAGGITISRPITETAAAVNTTLSIGGAQTSGTSIYSGNIALNDGTTLTSATGGEVDFNGVISGAQNVIVSGGGLVKLATGNSFGGAGNKITIQGGGILNAANATTALGNAANTVVFNNGTFQFPSVFDLSSSRTLTFTGGATFDTDGNAINFASAVGNGGAGGLILNDSAGTPGSLALSAVNTYTGGTTVTTGTLILSGAGTLGGTNGSLTVNTGGNLNLNGTNQSVGNLQGTGGFIFNNGTGLSTLTIGTGGATGGSYAGIIENNTGSGGTVALTKTGVGTITLTGANTYTGATSVNGGTLALSGSGSLNGSAIAVASGATFQINNSGTLASPQVAGTVTINGGTLSLSNGAVNTLVIGGSGNVLSLNGGATGFDIGGSGGSDQIQLASGLTASLSGTIVANLNLLNPLDGTNQTLISWSGYTGTGTFSLGSISNPSFASGYTLSLVVTPTGLVLDESGVSSAYWEGSAGSSWSNISNFTTDTAGTMTRSAALDSNTGVTFNATGAMNFANTTLDGAVTISTLTFNAGGVGIAPGTGGSLTIAGGGSAVTVGTGLGTDTISANVAMGASQTWTVGSGSTLAISGNVSGATFNLIKAGSGTLALSGTNSYSGATTVSGGVLNIGSADALDGTSGVTVNSGATLQLQGGFTTTTQTALNLSGNGTGTAGALENVSGNNTYTGAITLNAPTTIGSDANTLTLNSSTAISGSGQTLTLTGSGNGLISSVIGTGTGSLTKTGTGTWVLSGLNTYSGGTTLSSGTLQLSGSGTLGASTGALAVNGGLLDLNGTSQGVGALTGTGGTIGNNNSGTSATLTIGNGNGTGGSYSGSLVDNTAGTGTLSLVKTGTGTLTLSGTDTYSGSTTITGGALNLQSSGAATGSGINVASGAALQLTGNISTAAGVGITLNGAGVSGSPNGALESVSGSNTFGGPITLGSNSSIGTDLVGGSLTLNNGTITGSGFNLTDLGAGTTIINSVIGTGSGAVTMNGTGTLVLNGANTYTGATNLNSGTLSYNSPSAIVNSSSLNIGSGTNAVDFNYTGGGTTVSQVLNFTGAGGAVTLGNSGSGAINYTGAENFGSGNPLVLGNATDTAGGSIGSIGSGVTTLKKLGLSNSTWILTGNNTYTGSTTINGGVLQG